MENTALQQAIEMIQTAPHMLNMEDTVNLLRGFLPVEREQIETAFNDGWTDGNLNRYHNTAKNYYEQTFTK